MRTANADRRKRPPFLPIARWLIFLPSGPLIYASSRIFRSISGWPLPASLVALHYFSLLILAVSIVSFAVFLTLFGAWLCFMSPSAFERRITWWLHRFSAPHRNICNASRDELALEPVFDEVYRESFWMLRTPFGDYDCYPDAALTRLMPREFELERRVLRLDEDAADEWRLFLRSRPSLDEKIARVEALEASVKLPEPRNETAPDGVS